MTQRHIDALITFKILRLLSEPWIETDAFKLGIIDKKGTPLKKKKDLKTKDEKNAYSSLTRLVFSIKRMLNSTGSLGSKIATYATALRLIKESYDITNNDMFLIFENLENEHQEDIKERLIKEMKDEENILDEDVTNTANATNIAGLDEPFKPKPDDNFGGCPVFDVDSNTFCNTLRPKDKNKHYKKYLGKNLNDEENLGEKIRTFAKQNPKSAIVIRNEKSGEMRYIRHKSK